MSKTRCATCGEPLAASQTAAAIFKADTSVHVLVKCWCLTCWDSEDEVALRQYQQAQA